jgi:hypothetical protein
MVERSRAGVDCEVRRVDAEGGCEGRSVRRGEMFMSVPMCGGCSTVVVDEETEGRSNFAEEVGVVYSILFYFLVLVSSGSYEKEKLTNPIKAFRYL